MPGPISDSYDPEFGTGEVAAKIADAVRYMYGEVTDVLGHSKPIYIGDLVDMSELYHPIQATFTEWEWRIIRFALERAHDSL